MADQQNDGADLGFDDIGEAGIAIARRWVERGAHASYTAFGSVFGDIATDRHVPNVWRFLEDSVTGKGGFANGSYIIPFEKETKVGGAETKKIRERRAIAEYDAFPAQLCLASWDIILSQEDSIKREAPEGLEQASEFWANTDRQGNDILEVLESAWIQARLYLTGWLVVDKPNVAAESLADERELEAQPYAYTVKSANVPLWKLDDDDNLEAVVILEPTGDEENETEIPFRVWTKTGWAVFDRSGDSFSLRVSGKTDLGRCPVVPLHSKKPDGDKFIDATDMLTVARQAQTVYNRSSEKREVERKCASFLALPVKNASSYAEKTVSLGVEDILAYDGEAGEPKYITPPLEILEAFSKSSAEDKDAAYEAANMRGAVGNVVETSSGFHSEVEMSKTERRVARDAASLERAERLLTEIALLWQGIDPTDAEITISYPRKFGMRDADRALERLEKIEKSKLLRKRAKVAAARDTLQILFPRIRRETLEEMVEEIEAKLEATDTVRSAADRLTSNLAERRQRIAEGSVEGEGEGDEANNAA